MFDERKFKAGMVLAGVSSKDLAHAMGIDESTLYRKLKNNGDFRRDEINIYIELCHPEDPHSIFFAEVDL